MRLASDRKSSQAIPTDVALAIETHPKQVNCLNVGDNNLGDDDLPFIVQAVEVVLGARDILHASGLAVVLSNTRIRKRLDCLQQLLNMDGVRYVDVSGSAMASIENSFDKMDHTEKLICISLPHTLNVGLRALFKKDETKRAASEVVHKAYWKLVPLFSRRSQWRSDEAAAHMRLNGARGRAIERHAMPPANQRDEASMSATERLETVALSGLGALVAILAVISVAALGRATGAGRL
jgi:hypothetical protein